jgi:ribosomal protein S18 acetylase RimI-like enzyme
VKGDAMAVAIRAAEQRDLKALRQLGAMLMQAAIEWLRERGAPRVILWTAAQNDAARSLFQRLGFRDTMIEMTMELAR